MKKLLYLAGGFVGLGLGALGAVLPLLPAFPFLLLAAYCFARSSDRLQRWFLSTRLYKENLSSFVAGRGMTRRVKRRIMTLVTLTMAIGFALMDQVPVGQVILALVWAGHMLYFLFRVRTLSEGDEPEN